MENQEALQYIIGHCLGPDAERDGTAWNDAMMTAIEALEKQVPIKPLPQEMDIDGRAITPCGYCGEELPHNLLYNFCPYCGQAIDRRKNG